MSRTTTSSIPSTLYRLASSAGSPAWRSCWNCTPFTTWPSRTSMHAMMRLVSTSGAEPQEVPQDLQTGLAGLLRVKLHTEHAIALDRRGKRLAVRRLTHAVCRYRRSVGVREINVGARCKAVEQ